MDDDKREIRMNALLGAFALLASGLIVLGLSWEGGGYGNDAANRAAYYRHHAKREIAAHCRSSIPHDRADCAYKAVQAAREEERKEWDLAAQWVAAWWTQITGGAAVFGVALSAFG